MISVSSYRREASNVLSILHHPKAGKVLSKKIECDEVMRSELTVLHLAACHLAACDCSAARFGRLSCGLLVAGRVTFSCRATRVCLSRLAIPLVQVAQARLRFLELHRQASCRPWLVTDRDLAIAP